MAETRLTNISTVVPDVFSAFTVEPSIYRSALFNSGVMQLNGQISALLAGAGETFNLPFWQDIAGTSGDAPLEGTDATVNNLAAIRQIFRKQTRTKAWGSNDLVNIFSGDDVMARAGEMVINYWAQAYDIIGHKILTGVLLENIDADSSDLLNDVSGGTGSASYISDSAVIDAQAKLGENGNGFAAISMHPLTYAYLRKQDLIDFVPVSAQARELEFYMGMRVVQDRNAYVNSTDYYTTLLKPGALQYGVTAQGYIPTEMDRKPLDGFGLSELVTRRVFAIHPVGFQYLEAGCSAITPSDAELAAKECWNRAYAKENCPFVVIKHKLG